MTCLVGGFPQAISRFPRNPVGNVPVQRLGVRRGITCIPKPRGLCPRLHAGRWHETSLSDDIVQCSELLSMLLSLGRYT